MGLLGTAVNYSPFGAVYNAVTGSNLGDVVEGGVNTLSNGLVGMATNDNNINNVAPTEHSQSDDWPIVEDAKDAAGSIVEDAKDAAGSIAAEWDEHHGITVIDTAYNFLTGSEGIPHKARNAVSTTATNIIDGAQGLGDDAIKAVKKYWPFAAAGVVGLVVLKAATPAVVSNLIKKR